MKFKLIGADYIMLTAFILMLSCHGITSFLISQHTSVAETMEDAIAVIKVVEQNPFVAFVLQFKKFSYVYSLIFVPGIFAGFYYYIRKRYWYRREILNMIAIMVASFFLINFFNDFGYLMGYLIR